MDSGFSFASVILSYFLIGGGLFTGTLVGSLLGIDNEIVGYALLGGGAFVGGFVAARASRGSTIVEPAIGAIAVVATVVALAAKTDLGQMIWAMAQNETIKLVAGVGLTSMVGAILGAFISERAFGEATESSFPWIIYTAFSTFGASLLALFVVAMVIKSDGNNYTTGLTGMIAVAVGCLLAGMAVGASARSRPLGAAFLGGGIGVAGFFFLMMRLLGEGAHDRTQDIVAGLAILGGGGAIVTMIGAVVGWAAAGRTG